MHTECMLAGSVQHRAIWPTSPSRAVPFVITGRRNADMWRDWDTAVKHLAAKDTVRAVRMRGSAQAAVPRRGLTPA